MIYWKLICLFKSLLTFMAQKAYNRNKIYFILCILIMLFLCKNKTQYIIEKFIIFMKIKYVVIILIQCIVVVLVEGVKSIIIYNICDYVTFTQEFIKSHNIIQYLTYHFKSENVKVLLVTVQHKTQHVMQTQTVSSTISSKKIQSKHFIIIILTF